MLKRSEYRQVLYAACASLCAFLAACSGGATKVDSDLGIKGAPDWVNEGTQSVSNKGGRLIQGVGSSPPLGDESLQISTADNRARTEIARVVSTYLDVMGNDYMAATKQTEGYTADASIQQQINSVSKVVLNGSKILGRWKHDETGVIYSFAELDLKKVQDIIKANQNMNEGLKVYLLDNSNVAFDKIAKE
ncbi:MAG TPA: hypothetical protein VFX02_01825 [Gammaproteobacteria bacterium]|nr:hypothetical protein [Gammaproteobacteria bacterium]